MYTGITYSEGDIRLLDGPYSWAGRVEIYIAGTWGTIDDDPWTTENARVVCRQLGYPAQGLFTHFQYCKTCSCTMLLLFPL